MCFIPRKENLIALVNSLSRVAICHAGLCFFDTIPHCIEEQVGVEIMRHFSFKKMLIEKKKVERETKLINMSYDEKKR